MVSLLVAARTTLKILILSACLFISGCTCNCYSLHIHSSHRKHSSHRHTHTWNNGKAAIPINIVLLVQTQSKKVLIQC